MRFEINISGIIILAFATVKYMMILESLKIPERTYELIKKTENDWLRLFLAKTGMFFDCPVCTSIIAGGIAIVINSLSLLINLLLAISVLGFFLKKKMVDR